MITEPRWRSFIVETTQPIFTPEQCKMIIEAGRSEPKQDAYVGNKKGIKGGIIDTKTRTVQAISNPHTIFEKIIYDDSKVDYSIYDVQHLRDKFVKVIVLNKTDGFIFDRFVDRIQNVDPFELKIAENFNEFIGANVSDENLEVEDTEQLVNDYIDGVDTDLDKDRIKVQMRELMMEAQSLEIA